MLGFGILRAADGDHLDLGELVLADQAARIAPRRPGFGAEARRQRGHAHGLGDLVLGKDLLAHKVGQGDFGGGNEKTTICELPASICIAQGKSITFPSSIHKLGERPFSSSIEVIIIFQRRSQIVKNRIYFSFFTFSRASCQFSNFFTASIAIYYYR